MQTYDKESIRYTSMDTGQVWAKVGGSSSARQDADISPNLTEEFQSRKKDAALSSEMKKRLLKKRRLEKLQAIKNGGKGTASKSLETSKVDNQQAKGWHHKQELYDIDCGQKMARVVVAYYFDRRDALIKSSESPNAKWYHICPGSFEEKLYIEICNPR